jgi:hypothetical protein
MKNKESRIKMMNNIFDKSYIMLRASDIAHSGVFQVFLFALVAIGMVSCKDDGFYYQDEARVRLVGPEIYAAGTDSLTFSFVTYPADTTSKVMNVEVAVMGPVSDHARTANIIVASSLTTATNDLYEVPSTVVIPANAASAYLPVTLKRGNVLQTKAVRLRIEVAKSDDFGIGVDGQNHLTLIWTDVLSKPNNWSDLEEFFGSYSNVKYRFMLANAGGITGFNIDTMTWAALQSYKIKFQNALDEYNAAHPGNPLKDENGVLVTFS